MAQPRKEAMPPLDPLRQAGGGASETSRAIPTLSQYAIPHLRKAFESHAGSDKQWDRAEIESFLSGIQHHSSSDDLSNIRAKEVLDFNGFLEYMTSPHAAISIPRPQEDLSWPLASYLISSSHNTYLSGNQLYSDSTADSYVNVLLRGCRCVEVDVWDGDDHLSSSDSDSDSDTADAKNSSAGAGSPKNNLSRPERVKKRLGKLARMRKKLPDSVTARLERKSLDKKPGDKSGEAASKEEAEGNAPAVGILEPMVLHGYTLTKEIAFRDVCTAIRDSAFKTSDLPVIVSLEVHCRPEQQVLMVNIMNEVWKGLLIEEPMEDPQSLPSPGELKNKILVKVKYAPPSAVPDGQLSAGEDDRAPADGQKPRRTKKSPTTIQELSRLAIYTRGISFKSLTQPEATMATHIFSVSEKKFLDYHEKQGLDLFEHNRDYLMRAYPSGLRIGSSNLNPPVFWGSGTQIVALNWQETDEGMMLNEAMFAGTGGYVLKPEGYRPDIKTKAGPNIIVRKTLSLRITFFSAQAIPLPPDETTAKGFKPYVKVELHVDGCTAQHDKPRIKHDGHEREGEYKARTKTHKGCEVDFGGETLEFSDVPGLVEELTFMRFTVRDNEFGRDDLAAWAAVRLDRLGQGYRFVHLMDSKGVLTDGAVLVKIEKTLK